MSIRCRSLFAVAFYLTLVFAVPAALPFYVPPGKVSGEIFLHQRLKTQRDALVRSGDDASWRHLGVRLERTATEESAFYVTHELSATEIAAYKSQGIDIQPTYVPPVPGHHPYGYYLATVPYEKISALQTDSRLVRLDSLERAVHPQDDLGNAQTKVDLVHNGTGVPALNGAGVKVAMADAGFDLTHADLPHPVEAYDVTTGSSIGSWSTNVANQISPHGTHTLGTFGGNGSLSGGKYIGVAPGASFYLYKIGNNTDGSASDADIIKAITRAQTVGCRVFSMSLGGPDTYGDGSSALCQAVDAATAAGMLCFLSAGNEADGGEYSSHASANVPHSGGASNIGYTVDNSGSSRIDTNYELIYVTWRDGQNNPRDITLTCSNLGSGESIQLQSATVSPRGTANAQFVLFPHINAHISKTYEFSLSNTASATPHVQLYAVSGIGNFVNFDSTYTITDPAEADTAVAVGAWVQRTVWTDYQGVAYTDPSLTLNSLAYFSSRGPRIDGIQKPDLVAPGAATISARDSAPGLATDAPSIIDNDGLNLNGSGPANYYVMEGTSMATPHAAGVAALILQANPHVSPILLHSLMTGTASQSLSSDNNVGFGLIDAQHAVVEAESLETPKAAFSANGVVVANGGGPVHFGSVAVGAASPSVVFQVQNNGPVNLTTANLAVPADYTVTEQLASVIGAGNEDTFTVKLNTATAGTYYGTVQFTTNDPSAPIVSVSVVGTVLGAAPSKTAARAWTVYQ